MKHDGAGADANPNPAETPTVGPDTAPFLSDSESLPSASPAPPTCVPKDFGRYRILHTLGSGGMGAVYLAHDTQLDRNIALKVPRFAAQNEAAQTERFYREARAMATLRHPNLCAVHDVGQHAGLHYLTMDYIEGKDLSEWLKARQAVDALTVVDLVRKVALALHEAHQHGVIHRDLKPSNIMIDRRGEPIVMDFGLARREQKADAEITQYGTLLGSPAYMAPEQIEGGHTAGPAADVYSLGVVFYQLLCRRLPFEGPVAVILAQALTQDPPRPSERCQGVDPGLEAICLKALARVPSARYPSMRDLVAALDAWQAAPVLEKARAFRREATQRPALVPGCKHDLFVCYCAHDDEPPPGSSSTGWVTTLIDNLDWRLRQLNGGRTPLSIWMDDELARKPAWDEAVTQRLDQTAALLVVLSPGWTAWASNLEGSYLGNLLRRHLAGDRVFLVEADRVLTGRPPELTGLRAYPFWKFTDGNTVNILGYPRPKPEVDHEYYARLDDLARAVHKRVQELIERKDPATVEAPVPARSAPAVYLAEVTDDLDSLREEVERCLNQYGYDVLPARWYPREPGEFRQALESDLKNCLLFVQLVGPFPGKRPPGSTRSYAALQYDVAVQRELPVLQWRDAALDPAQVRDPEHAAFVGGKHVQAVELESFKRDVVARAAQEMKRRDRAASGTKPSTDQAFVFINVDRGDLPLADNLCGLLEENGCSYALPMHEGRPDEIRQDLEANLLDCDGLIIVYGEITEQWVREQLRQWRKILYRRDKPLRALAVYEGPPSEKQRLGMRLPKMRVIDCRKGLQQDKIRSFLDELANG